MNKSSIIDFFNYNIDNLTMEETVEKINNAIKSNKNIQHVVLNVAKLVKSQKDDLLRESIQSADIINIDGTGIIYGMKLLGFKPKERVTGIDLMDKLLEVSEKNNFKVFFLGATDEVLNKMISLLKMKYTKLKIAGFRNGYFSPEDEKYIIDEISFLKPHILFVGISSPKKEVFIRRYKNTLNTNFIMGVGGSFDIYAGKIKRAPLFFQNHGIEWLYRIYQEPRRMWKRYLITNVKYLLILLKAVVLTKQKIK